MASKMSNSALPSTRFQDQLAVECRTRHYRDPSWQIYSDRRGGRTAWSAAVTVEGQSIAARLWYDGQYINNAKEEAAELAVKTLYERGTLGTAKQQQQQQQQHTSPQAVSHIKRW